ncbi:hypothetical protein PIB30_005634 [Stylosanthes scabra]|uniref:Secreted protein n=1 Tax=Stylosanthes scabra TaxID=79078 RepID=A0ABU6T3R8_9FABA|nr:hypothetical protein [Stylosanthes scabra]
MVSELSPLTTLWFVTAFTFVFVLLLQVQLAPPRPLSPATAGRTLTHRLKFLCQPFGKSSLVSFSSSCRNESKEPRLVIIRHRTRPHAPPEVPCPICCFSAQKLQQLLDRFQLSAS